MRHHIPDVAEFCIFWSRGGEGITLLNQTVCVSPKQGLRQFALFQCCLISGCWLTVIDFVITDSISNHAVPTTNNLNNKQ